MVYFIMTCIANWKQVSDMVIISITVYVVNLYISSKTTYMAVCTFQIQCLSPVLAPFDFLHLAHKIN